MGGIIKHIFWVAPLAVVILLITIFMSRENSVDMRTQEAAFDRDWNEQMATMSKKDPEARKRYEQRAVQVQKQYSSLQSEQKITNKQMGQTEREIDQAVREIDSQLKGGKGGGR